MMLVGFSEEEIQKVIRKSEKSRADVESLTEVEKHVSATSIEELLKELNIDKDEEN